MLSIVGLPVVEATIIHTLLFSVAWPVWSVWPAPGGFFAAMPTLWRGALLLCL